MKGGEAAGGRQLLAAAEARVLSAAAARAALPQRLPLPLLFQSLLQAPAGGAATRCLAWC